MKLIGIGTVILGITGTICGAILRAMISQDHMPPMSFTPSKNKTVTSFLPASICGAEMDVGGGQLKI
jgi:hypothetical protein